MQVVARNFTKFYKNLKNTCFLTNKTILNDDSEGSQTNCSCLKYGSLRSNGCHNTWDRLKMAHTKNGPFGKLVRFPLHVSTKQFSKEI